MNALHTIAAEIARIADDLDRMEASDEFTANVLATRLDEQARSLRLGIHCQQMGVAA